MAGNVDNQAVAATTTVLRMSPNGGNRQLTGLTGGADGRVILLINPDSANTVTLMHDVTSTAANRFYCPKGVDVVVRHREGVWLEYDTTNTRWHVVHGAMPENGPDADITVGATGATGTAGQFSRAGHGHKLTNSTATPAADSAAGTAGTATNAPLPSDHSHPFGTSSKSLWIPAGLHWAESTLVVPSVTGSAPDNITNGAAMSASATAGIMFNQAVPDDWASGAVTYTIYYSVPTGDATPHTIRWSMDALEIVPGTTTAVAAGTTTAFTGSSAARTVNVVYTEAAQTLLTPNAVGNIMRMNLRRLGADAADTMTDTARIHGILLKYTGKE